MNRRHWLFSPDARCVAMLVLLWLLFFWRLFTPIPADQASLKQGDFSGQFVAFGGYQYTRFVNGEVPLWNPYNNGGMPFIADTQAAVFYPPRLATIALAHLSGTGWTYHALELEMTVHVLAYTLLMYLFVRRLTGNVFGAFTAAVVAGYGGYLSGYPPLQLAVLEAGIWLPLAALGILEATRTPRWQPLWLILTGWALGLSWMAGHPQTSFFLTYLLLAYYGYRVYNQRYSWTQGVIGVVIFGAVSVGVVAVTLFPGLEYLVQTSRSDLGFDAKSGGFPYQDVVQMLYPGIVSTFSPLYIGLTGLVLAVVGLWRRTGESLFWGITALVALLIGFGGESVVFHSLYNLLPGLRFFRGQERAAYLVANSLAILAGIGAAYLITLSTLHHLRRGVLGLLGFCLLVAVLIVALWLGSREAYDAVVGTVVFTALITAALYGIFWLVAQRQQFRWLLPALVVFELFSVNINAPSNYDPVPPTAQLPNPPLLDLVRADTNTPFRVDGFRGLHDNYGSLYGVADIQGISPLFLTGPQQIIEYGLPDERAWELFAVRYVWSDVEALPVPWELLGTGEDRYGSVNLFRLTAPRPYAHLVYDAVIVDRDEAARQQLADPTFDPRIVAVLHRDPGITLPETPPEGAGTTITQYAPEKFTIIANTPENAILTLAHVDYPGWYATIDGQPAPLIRAYGGLSALALPAGDHTIELVYNPLSYRVGAIVSLFTWAVLGILVISLAVRRVRR